MTGKFARDVAVVGAGRIGLPWAAVLAVDHSRHVTCVDIDEEIVAGINGGEAPFEEPQLASYLTEAVTNDNLRATTDTAAVADHRFVAFTINAPRREVDRFLDAVGEYAEYLTDDHVVVVRSTLPVATLKRLRTEIESRAAGSPSFAVFPERLAEGKAIEEIQTLPKVVGVDDRAAEEAVRRLLEPSDCELLVTDPETAMFVKLIDNSYRDAIFAIANQIAYTADQLKLDAHEAIKLANYGYPRNDIPKPGIVGGKCLPKDPHFLTDGTVCDQPTTPDLFNATRRTNATAPNYIATELLRKQPSKVCVLGLAYKRDVSDTFNSQAKQIKEILDSQGVETVGYDPNTAEGTDDIAAALNGADVILLAVNHSTFSDIAVDISKYAPPGATVYDIWNVVDQDGFECDYDGFGMDGRGQAR